MFFRARREPDVRIETKVTDGMRYHHVDAAKGLDLKRFPPKITCKVWTQNDCKIKERSKCLGCVWYSSYSPRDGWEGNIVYNNP